MRLVGRVERGRRADRARILGIDFEEDGQAFV